MRKLVWDRPNANTKHAYRVVMPATKRRHRGVSDSTDGYGAFASAQALCTR
jgi:hypothetical protein